MPSAHRLLGAQLPPQSVSVSVPLVVVSEHVGSWHRLLELQSLLLQSLPEAHTFPGSHFWHVVPPQSMSDSEPFLVKSPHVGAAHFELVQTALWQSVPTRHAAVAAHFVVQVVPPPQSVSVSVPFFTPSGHFGTWQVLAVVPEHTPDWQSSATAQTLPFAQGAHGEVPPQSTSDSPWFLVTSEQLSGWQM